MRNALARRIVALADRNGWVTWERRSERARILTVTNAWPREQVPMLGIFLRDTVDGLRELDVESDVLFIRGYRGAHCYLAGCVVMWLLSGEYELVNSHGGETAVVARCYRGSPVIASYWGSDILGPQQGSGRQRLKTLLVSRILRAHSVLMTATTTKSREMERALPRRAAARNWVIPDGVDRERFQPIDRDWARSEAGWPPDEVTVISVGRDVPLKRLWLARAAVEIATRQIPALRWRLISDASPEQMPFQYNAADCLIHTSASEGSPNVIKEALACGLAVVATPSGDIEELLQGVDVCALCPPDPATLARELVRCIDAGGRNNGRERTAWLSREAISARVLECYASVGVAP